MTSCMNGREEALIELHVLKAFRVVAVNRAGHSSWTVNLPLQSTLFCEL